MAGLNQSNNGNNVISIVLIIIVHIVLFVFLTMPIAAIVQDSNKSNGGQTSGSLIITSWILLLFGIPLMIYLVKMSSNSN